MKDFLVFMFVAIGLLASLLGVGYGLSNHPVSTTSDGTVEFIAGNEDFEVYRVHKPGLQSMTVVVSKAFNRSIAAVKE